MQVPVRSIVIDTFPGIPGYVVSRTSDFFHATDRADALLMFSSAFGYLPLSLHSGCCTGDHIVNIDETQVVRTDRAADAAPDGPAEGLGV
jgi:hypothetical protein